MQIHEITLNEANIGGALKGAVAGSNGGGAIGGAAALIGGVGKALAAKAGASQGIDIAGNPNVVSPGSAQAAGMKMSGPLIQSLSRKANETWVKEVQTMLTKSVPPATAASQLKTTTLKVELLGLVNSLVGFDTTQLAAMDSGNGQAKETDARLVAAMDEVINATIAPKPDPNAMKTAWDKTATYIVQAQNVKAFNQSNSGGTAGGAAEVTVSPKGGLLYDGKPYNASNPRHAAAQAAIQKSTTA
jgi:hypothetical protein